VSTRPLLEVASHFAFLVSVGRQITLGLIVDNQEMEDDKATPLIIEASRLRNGVVITFENGKCALYTAALLYAMFPNADELIQDMSNQD
jgi:hypothetical protein